MQQSTTREAASFPASQ